MSRTGEKTYTLLVPAGGGPGVQGFNLQVPDTGEFEVAAWTSGNPGPVNVVLFTDDVPLPEAQGRLADVNRLVDCVTAIPPGAIACAPVDLEGPRKLTLFWDAAPAQAFLVTIRTVAIR